MKNTKFLFGFLVAILFFVTACGDKEDAPKPPSRTELLAAKTWKINKILASNGIDASNDPRLVAFKAMQFKFNADGSYTLTSLLGSQTGNWVFAENETKVVLDPNTAGALTFDIAELKDNAIKFRTVFPPASQDSVTLELVPA
jgi:hypothetical protein